MALWWGHSYLSYGPVAQAHVAGAWSFTAMVLDMAAWRYGDMAIWRYGDMAAWRWAWRSQAPY